MRCSRHGRACAEPPSTLVHPATRARYAIRDLLGRGGFARVYVVAALPPDDLRAPAASTPRGETGSLAPRPQQPPEKPHLLALKVISKCRLGDTAVGREALRNEVSIHRQLQHPAIVPLMSFWEDQYRIYLLMHLVDGPQLERFVHARGRLPEPEACVYAANILEALSYLHANRLVHRDLKLANLVLTRDRTRVMLCDFGLAAHLDSLRASTGPTVCGTPNYVAPELLTSSVMARTAGKRTSYKTSVLKHVAPASSAPVIYSTSADLWSMGVVLFTMLVGSGPFDSDDLSRTFRRIRAARFTFPIGLKISPNAKSLIRSLLAEDPAKRPSADQALRHPFFAAHDVPKLFLRPQPEIRPENFSADSRPLADSRGDRDDRADRVDGRIGDGSISSVKTRRMPGSNRHSVDNRRWSGTHHVVSGQQPNSAISQDINSRRERPGSFREDRERPAGRFSTRNLPRPAKERSASLCTAETVERSSTSERRSSLNTARTLNKLKESRRPGISGSNRRSSLLSSEKRNEVLNLSVTLSAALLRGRKFLDEQENAKAGTARRSRFESVAKPVDSNEKAPPLVQRWLDYTSKYGFATMMEGGRTSCCFNDGSIMFFTSESADIPDFAYIPPRNAASGGDSNAETEKQRANDISKKACLCTLFADMMVEGGRGSMYDLPSACNVSFMKPDADPSNPGHYSASGDHKDIVHVREWARFRHFRAAAFRLSNHSIHVKFDVGEDRCDDFLFTPTDGMLYYREAKAGDAWRCAVRHLGEFSSHSEYVHKQLELCSQAISRFLE